MASDDSTIEIEQVGIGDVLKRHRLRVPPNQREYAWGESQVLNLLEDITLAISTDEPQHFLGSLVTIKRPHNVLEVADGQQRLATTALILSAMRNIVGGQHPNLTKLIDGFLSSIDTSTLEERPNISLNTADTSVFHSLIVTGQVGEGYIKNRVSHQLLKQAYELAKSHLNKVIAPLPSQEKWTAFQGWINYFQYKTKAILLIVSNEANSFRMFETLNDRGLKVSQSDLIKNYVFGQSGPRIDTAQQSWSSMKGALEALDEEDIMMNFIRHSLIVTNGFLQQKNIYDKIQSTTRGQQSSIALLSTWESLANDYVALSNPESSVWSGFPSKIRDNIKVLNLFDIAPLKPLLLAAAKKMPKNEAALTFEKVVAIGVRLIIASRTTTQSVEKPLGDIALKIWKEEIKDSKGVVVALAPSIPNDQQFKEAFESATVSNAQFARYYLRSLERVAKEEPEPWLIPNDDANIITLEHVCPQKPEANWPSWTADDVKAYVKRIGNMVLLTAQANSTLKSSSFADKQTQLSQSPYETTSMVGENSRWLPEDVVARQKRLADLALKAWPLR
ncbi:DUF262 domain-containing protein [Nitrobacter vulgaris]|uniref:DUF262 domain-containing protein n=1 Tax=Nitrobacter vulgaris TaxID=29421 RepID=A0A1V4HY36_NITVU|nr:DUF262 domain-containing protein [Nitrobacter vulgaris]OPH82898.1 hypothetical protein B2M20_10255 [Nitrobacter vulgaris]